MGYITATPRGTPEPSFYKLPKDNILVSALTNVSHLVSHITDPNGMSMNASTDVHAFVLKEDRKINYKALDPNFKIETIEEDIEYEVLRENFNVYDLSNGMVMSVKTIISQINKTNGHNQEGEPIYNVNAQPIVKFKKK